MSDLLADAAAFVNGPEPDGTTDAARALTDLGNAERLVDRHGIDLRYCHPWKAWLVWDGTRWAIDDSAESARRAKEAVTVALVEEAAVPGADSAQVLKHAARSQSASRIRGALELASSDIRVVVRPADLDQDPFLLNVANGTLDLRTGVLREHRREDLITKRADVSFDPDATAPRWNACLERWLPDPEVRSFMQRLAGYALTGDATEHIITIAHGSTGQNGKTTLLTALLDLLGDYALAASPEVMIASRRPGGATPEVAELVGRRYVLASETDEGAPLAEARVKSLVGGDRIKGRALYLAPVEITPTWTLVLMTNHLPRIKGTDGAIWRRIALVPFTVRIPDDEKDKDLPAKLARERSGILNWAFAGCLEWQRAGLSRPKAVEAATALYRADSDPLAEWLADRCVVSPHATATSADLWESYVDHSSGRPEISRTAFGKRLGEMGCEATNGKPRAWVGIGLLERSR